MSNRRIIRIDVCCNDPDNGLFVARAGGIQLQDGLLELEADDMSGPVFREHVGKLQLSRRSFPVLSSKEWFGNWCWNAYWMKVQHAVELLIYAHGLGVFHRNMGDHRLFDRWGDQRPFDLNDRYTLCHLLLEAAAAEKPEQLA